MIGFEVEFTLKDTELRESKAFLLLRAVKFRFFRNPRICLHCVKPAWILVIVMAVIAISSQ